MRVTVRVVTVAVLALPGAVRADEPAVAPIPEIIVTARRIEEPLSRLPVAVTAFDADDVQRLQATSLDDLARFTPGFSYESATGRGPNSNRPAMRGLTTIRNGIANSTVAATFVDGVYLGGSIQSAQLFDLERVEIVRGPQSAQFGRATYAGAINYVTRRATSELASAATLTAADHDTWRANGWISGPLLGEGLRVFIGGGIDTYGGEYPNTRDGRLVGGQQSGQATIKLESSLPGNVEAALRLGGQWTADDHYAMWLQPRTANNCCFRTPEAPRAREYYVGEALTSREVTLWTDALEAAGGAGIDLHRALGSLRLDWRPGSYTVSSLTGWVLDELWRGFDASYAAYDPVPAQPGSFLQRDKLEQRDFSEELRLVSPAAGKVRWQLGAYWYRGRLDQVVEDRVVVNPDDSVSVLPNFADLVANHVRNAAVFGSVETDLPGRVTPSVELRYAADRVEVATTPNVGATGTPRQFAATYHSLAPRFTVSWRATEALVPYASIARGQSPGTFNPVVPALPDGTPDESYRNVGEEVVWSYEGGLRATSADRRLRGALAGYWMDVDGQQFTRIIELPSGATASILDNVGHTTVAGIELEGSATLREGLVASATYAWTQSIIRKGVSEEVADLRGSNGSAADIQDLGNLAGQRTPRVPEHVASLAVEYRHPLPVVGDAFAGADWTFESSRYAQEDNLIETGDRHLVGLHAGLAGRHAELRLWVTNLADDRTPVDVQRYIDRRFGTLPSYPQEGGRPSSTPRGFGISLPHGRQAGLTLAYHF